MYTATEPLIDRARALHNRWKDAVRFAHGYLEGSEMRRVWEENAAIIDAQAELAILTMRRLP